jgi:hypothetical protein
MSEAQLTDIHFLAVLVFCKHPFHIPIHTPIHTPSHS